MTELSIIPAAGLIKTADPNSNKKSQFGLFSDSWLELQGYVGAALELPLTTGDFEEKYGSLGDSQTIKNCIQAMRQVREASTEFGNPKTLRAELIKNPNLLATPTPPTEIYTHTVWLGQRVHQTAANLVSGYESVCDGLQGLPKKEQVENLKEYLFDQTMGPIPLSEQMSKEVRVLIQKLGTFEQKMNEYNEKFKEFTKGASAMIQEVDLSIGGISQKIKDLEKSRDEAYQAWKDYTIAAATTSVGCALIGGLLAPFTFGLGALVVAGGVVAGAVLGAKAVENRKAYNRYCDEIKAQTVAMKKKQRLRSDLGDFNLQMQRVAPAMSAFLKNLQTIEGVWLQMNNDMVAISQTINESNVGDSPFIVKIKSQRAVDSWKAIDEAAKQFTVESLVDYTSIAFGDQMPESMAKAA